MTGEVMATEGTVNRRRSHKTIGQYLGRQQNPRDRKRVSDRKAEVKGRHERPKGSRRRQECKKNRH
jgi:hypothetical protein